MHAAATDSVFFFLHREIDLPSFYVCRLLLSSWTSVSSRTPLSTSLSVSKAALDRWGCSWWRRARSRNFASAWWPSRTPRPTPSKCTECCAGKSTLTSCWGKQFPETSRCGEACGLLTVVSADWVKCFINDSWMSWWIVPLGTVEHRNTHFYQLKLFIWLIYFLDIYNFIKVNC